MLSDGAAVSVADLNISAAGSYLVRDVSMQVQPGSICALLGESGSGKTTTALALLGYARSGAERSSGSVQISGTTVSGASADVLQGLRGSLISYVPQDPASALNPALRVEDALASILDAKGVLPRSGDRTEREEVIRRSLESVDLPVSRQFRRRYPHQLSGGQQQRVALAIAMACRPRVLVLDEPTTGLDVVTERKILDEVLSLRDQHGTAIIYVTHDLRIANLIADRVMVMYAGEVVEEGAIREVLSRPKHPYTAALIRAVPFVEGQRLVPLAGSAKRPEAQRTECAFADRCDIATPSCRAGHPQLQEVEPGRQVRCINHHKDVVEFSRRPVQWPAASDISALQVDGLSVGYGRDPQDRVLKDVSLEVKAGESVGVLGLSGSGKSTLLRALIGLTPPLSGRVRMDGKDLPPDLRRRSREERRKLGFIFQNPYQSLNPRRTVVASVALAAKRLNGLSHSASVEAAEAMLSLVRLPDRLNTAYPRELSGGERQRVAIAQALVGQPEVLLCDEVTSALDVSVQAAIVELLRDLAGSLNMALLFVTHDLGVVSSLCSRVYLLDQGVVAESGLVSHVLTEPRSQVGRDIVLTHQSNTLPSAGLSDRPVLDAI